MDALLRDGSLGIVALESSCDVTISCQGRKLRAHKIMLSIASPLLQELLKADACDTATVIMPDVPGETMSHILDYIYTGSVLLHPGQLADFLTCASLLSLRVEPSSVLRPKQNLPEPFETCTFSECGPACYPCCQTTPDFKFPEGRIKFSPVILQDERRVEETEACCADGAVDYSGKDEGATGRRKTLRKVPNLMPISRGSFGAFKVRRGLYNRVFPSPWIPKVVPLNGDPRTRYKSVLSTLEIPRPPCPPPPSEENDSNNNSHKLHPSIPAPALHRPLVVLPPSPPLEVSTPTPPALKASSVRSAPDDLTSCSSPGSDSGNEPGPKGLDKSDQDTKDEGAKPYKCEDCGKKFSQLRNYKYHRSVHEGTKEFAARCPECGKIFNDRGYLSSHLKIHRDRKEYGCPHCPKRFNQRVAYNMHLRIHTGVKPHVCATCGKSFSRKMLLKQHQRVHTGERPYQCPECGKTFADRSNMSLHARLHTGVKPYSCSLCPKSFTKKHHLKTHMNYHTGLKPYECQKCGLTFSQSSNMRTHYKKCIQKSATNEAAANNSN